tara:strand:+ start:13218 stop:14015 length:798 start_codon:yes stop_codon:yes gene_type:complete
VTATVNINKGAFFEMVMAAFEAYAVKHHGKHIVALETHAQLWGKVNKTLPFKCSVDHFSIDSSAKQERGGVTPEPLSLTIKKDIAQAFGEDFSHLGTYHTHPYLRKTEVATTNCIRREKLYDFSAGDHLCEVGEASITVGKKLYSVALVMTIYAAEKADDRKDGPIDAGLVEFSLGNVKLWLKAQVYQHIETETLTEADWRKMDIYKLISHKKLPSEAEMVPLPIETDLQCDIDFFMEKFGRLKISSRKSEYESSETAESRWFTY